MHTNRGHFFKIRALFLQNQGTFFLFLKKGGGDLPPFPPLVERLNMSYWKRQCSKVLIIKKKHDFFKNNFFSSTIIQWNEVDWNTKNSESTETFKKNIPWFIKKSPNSAFNWHSLKKIKLLPQLRLFQRQLSRFSQPLLQLYLYLKFVYGQQQYAKKNSFQKRLI